MGNPTQEHFDVLHTLLIKNLLESKVPDDKRDLYKSRLGEFLQSYNAMTRYMGYEIKNTLKQDVLNPEEKELKETALAAHGGDEEALAKMRELYGHDHIHNEKGEIDHGIEDTDHA